MDDVEREYIKGLINEHGDNRKQLAAAMGISVRTMYRKLKKLGLN